MSKVKITFPDGKEVISEGVTLHKSFSVTLRESTCQKRITVCEIYSSSGTLLARESNRCNPEGGTCHRIGVSNEKEDYPKDSNCNWTHAEIMAIEALPHKIPPPPYKAILYGHDFLCDNCERALKAIGVEEIIVKPELLTK